MASSVTSVTFGSADSAPAPTRQGNGRKSDVTICSSPKPAEIGVRRVG
jgi:hypothetical protein